MCQFTRHRIGNCQHPQTHSIGEAHIIKCPIAHRRADTAEGKAGLHCLVTATDFIPCSLQVDCYDCKVFRGERIFWPFLCKHECPGSTGEAVEAQVMWEDRYKMAVMLNIGRVTNKERMWDLFKIQKQAILDYEDGLMVDYPSITGKDLG